jgi:hypothetical protein
MFDKSQKDFKKEERSIKKEYLKALKLRLYNGYDIGFIAPYDIEYEDVIYNIQPEFETVIDHYGSDGSIELSHKQFLGYSNVTGFNGMTDKLNFRFLGAHDGVNIVLSDDIHSICLNMSNLRNTFIKSNSLIDYDIVFDCGVIDAIGSLKAFLKNNFSTIGSINFDGVNNKMFQQMFLKVCSCLGQDIVSFAEKAEKVNKSI